MTFLGNGLAGAMAGIVIPLLKQSHLLEKMAGKKNVNMVSKGIDYFTTASTVMSTLIGLLTMPWYYNAFTMGTITIVNTLAVMSAGFLWQSLSYVSKTGTRSLQIQQYPITSNSCR